MEDHKSYSELEQRFARASRLGDAMAMLSWDSSTMMPPGGAEARAEQTATLSSLHHELLTKPEIKGLLKSAEGETLSDWQRANLNEMQRDYIHAAAVPGKLVEDLSLASSACEMAWRAARPAANFARVKEPLTNLLQLTREVAKVKSQALQVSPYDALLDQYEPGGRSADIDVLFADLGAFLPKFLAKVQDKASKPPKAPKGPFPVENQRNLGLKMMETLGFEFDHGRLDVSRHPFSGGTPDDVRITTRYDEADFMRSMMGVLHETGHALYERGLPAQWRTQPVGRARGMSIHESQSLLMEMQACRSRAFFTYAAPHMQKAFGRRKAGWDAETLHAVNVRVNPGFIRVDADEVTYPAHVILRYRLEKALIGGELEVSGLPSAWNAGLKELLGITPPDDRLGCLQDIHWYDGAFGYFPTYTMGAMTAAQLFAAAKKAVPGLEKKISVGDFKPLLKWLRANIHSLGCRYSANELLIKATGRPLETKVFKAHLKRRYLDDNA